MADYRDRKVEWATLLSSSSRSPAANETNATQLMAPRAEGSGAAGWGAPEAIGRQRMAPTRFGSWGDEIWTNRYPEEIGNDLVTNIFGVDKHTSYATTQGGDVLRSGGDGRWVGDRIEGISPHLQCIWGTAPDNMYVCGGRGVDRGSPE